MTDAEWQRAVTRATIAAVLVWTALAGGCAAWTLHGWTRPATEYEIVEWEALP